MALRDAVNEALAELDLTPADRGTAELARVYALEIDSGVGDLARLGPPLLSCLEALGMSPRARAALAKGVTSGTAPVSPLDELRARRAARVNDASTVDAPAG